MFYAVHGRGSIPPHIQYFITGLSRKIHKETDLVLRSCFRNSLNIYTDPDVRRIDIQTDSIDHADWVYDEIRDAPVEKINESYYIDVLYTLFDIDNHPKNKVDFIFVYYPVFSRRESNKVGQLAYLCHKYDIKVYNLYEYDDYHDWLDYLEDRGPLPITR